MYGVRLVNRNLKPALEAAEFDRAKIAATLMAGPVEIFAITSPDEMMRADIASNSLDELFATGAPA